MSLFKNFPPIYDTLGKEADNFPKLDLGDRRGDTDYIDFILPEDMSHPIMIGTDCYKRPFIAIKVRRDNGNYVVGTFFQRYTNNPYEWAYGTTHSLIIYHESRFHCSEDYTNLTQRLHIFFYNKRIKECGCPCKDKINGSGPGNITLVY